MGNDFDLVSQCDTYSIIGDMVSPRRDFFYGLVLGFFEEYIL